MSQLHATGIDAEMFRSLFTQYYKPVRNYLYFKCGDMQLAEDLAQEAFVTLWDRRDEIRREQVKSYLYTIATRLLINHAKHRQVILRFQQLPVQALSNQSPQYLMEEEEFRQRLEETLSALPEKQRSVFLMNRIEKLTYQEIAERLGLSVKTVEKRMHKALEVLRRLANSI